MMMKQMALRRLFLGLLLLIGPIAAQDPGLSGLVDRIVDRPAARRAFWGVQFIDLDSGEVVYQYNEEKLFVPASNAKLFSTALALSRLGPDRRFATRLVAEEPLGAGGAIQGDLLLIGGADPNFSSRIVPYNPKAEYAGDPLEPIRRLAKQAHDRGLRKVAGNIVGDDTRFVWTPYPEGWALEDSTWSYGAPVSALSFNDNRIDVLVRPGSGAGQPAMLRLEPSVDYYSVRNMTRTGAARAAARALSIELKPDQKAIRLWGDISVRSPGRELSIAVDDPALFAAMALKQELEKLGVEVAGAPAAKHYDQTEVPDLRGGPPAAAAAYALELGAIESASLREIIKITNKTSQNLHAEMLLREVGYSMRGVGSHEAGIEEMRAFLKEAGLSPWEFFLSDASGLSRKDLVSPAATVKLLRHMWQSPLRDAYVESLATGGEDGTLDWRFSRSAAKSRIRAKTGTLSHVTALSGYATTLDGRRLAFSIFVNNFGVSASYIRNLVDEIVIAAVESSPAEVTGSRPSATAAGRP
jgi:D-alanyl-D-alanine carboxypeptidase/D-alanyl-D-alanine-endopeptidase (penicillin-binding protein 4)